MSRPWPWLTLGLLSVAVAALGWRNWQTAGADATLGRLLALLVGWVAFQMVALPAGLVKVLSPARAEVIDAAASVGVTGSMTTLSVQPATTLEYLLLLCGYVLVFLLVQGLSDRLRARAWLVLLPVVAVAIWQAVLGIGQYMSGQPSRIAHGSYVNRNHFAGLLEMALPVAFVWPFLWTAGRERDRPVAALVIGWGSAVVILTGTVYSLSRMGFLAALFGLGVTGGLVLLSHANRQHGRLTRVTKVTTTGIVVAAVVGLFFWLPPSVLIARFAQLSATEDMTPDHRVALLKETPRLIWAFAVFGCGLGNFEAAYPRYKSLDPFYTDDYAHNDYLQLAAELGAGGMTLLAAVAFITLRKAWRLALLAQSKEARWLGAGCCGALAAILLHSLADYNLYIPANALTAVWIGAVAAGSAEATLRA